MRLKGMLGIEADIGTEIERRRKFSYAGRSGACKGTDTG